MDKIVILLCVSVLGGCDVPIERNALLDITNDAFYQVVAPLSNDHPGGNECRAAWLRDDPGSADCEILARAIAARFGADAVDVKDSRLWERYLKAKRYAEAREADRAFRDAFEAAYGKLK